MESCQGTEALSTCSRSRALASWAALACVSSLPGVWLQLARSTTCCCIVPQSVPLACGPGTSPNSLPPNLASLTLAWNNPDLDSDPGDAAEAQSVQLVHLQHAAKLQHLGLVSSTVCEWRPSLGFVLPGSLQTVCASPVLQQWTEPSCQALQALLT